MCFGVQKYINYEGIGVRMGPGATFAVPTHLADCRRFFWDCLLVCTELCVECVSEVLQEIERC
jgi:hypothetical protein